LLSKDSFYTSAIIVTVVWTDFRSFSTHSSHLKFGLPAYLFPPGFPRNTFFTVLPSDTLTRWPTHYSILTFILVTICSFLH